MSRPDHDAAPGRLRHARRRAPVVPVTVGVLGIAFVGMVVGTVTSTAWLAIAAPIVMMFVGIGGVALYMKEPSHESHLCGRHVFAVSV